MHFGNGQRAGPHGLPVNQHRAGAADALGTAVLHRGQASIFAQIFQQVLVRVHGHVILVQSELEHSGCSFRCQRYRAATIFRLYSLTLAYCAIPELLAAHGVEERLCVTELQPVVLLLLKELFLYRSFAEVEYMFIGRAQKDVVCPAIQYLRSQLEIAAVQILQHRVIAIEAIGRDGYHIVFRSQPQVLRQLDRSQHIADAGGAKQVAQAQGKVPVHAQR